MINWVALSVFIFFFLLVTVLGFVASRWRRGDLNLLNEWGLAGRRFGTVVTWFLLGGDLYTAYTFIAVPAAMYGLGALNGWFAVPYTILVYPLIFVLMPKFWSVCKQRGYMTAADFVKDRFGSNGLALAMAFTGILATLPYIALQMYGIQVSLAALGIPLTLPIFHLHKWTAGSGNDCAGERLDDFHRIVRHNHLYSDQARWFWKHLCGSPYKSRRQSEDVLRDP